MDPHSEVQAPEHEPYLVNIVHMLNMSQTHYFVLNAGGWVYLVIHNNHVSTEEVMVCYNSCEPLGGWVLSVHTNPVPIQGIWTCKENINFHSINSSFFLLFNLKHTRAHFCVFGFLFCSIAFFFYAY